MNIREATWCVIDTETTGVDIETAQVCEIAAVMFRGGKPIERKSQLLNPGIPIPESVSAIHEITDEMVKDKPTLLDVASKFIEFADRADVLVGYNALTYDFPLLVRLCFLHPGMRALIENTPVVDPLVLIRCDKIGKFWKGQGRHRLGNVAERLGVQADGRLHRATADCFLTGKVLWKLLEHPEIRKLSLDVQELSDLICKLAQSQQAEFEAYKQRVAV